MADRLTAGDKRPIQKRKATRGWTKAKRTLFLTELAESCNVRRAAAAGMTASGIYQLRKRETHGWFGRKAAGRDLSRPAWAWGSASAQSKPLVLRSR